MILCSLRRTVKKDGVVLSRLYGLCEERKALMDVSHW